MGISRNLYLYVPYHILSLEGVCHGLYVLWLIQHKEIPAATVAVMLAAGDLLLMALQVPTGMLADRLGHRLSLVAGSIAQVAGLLAMWLGSTVWAIGAGVLLIGVGDAFRGGADEALLYRSCVASGKEEIFERIVARSAAVSQVTLVGLVLAGGWLADHGGFDLAWAAETALAAIGVVVALCMVETGGSAVDSRAEHSGASAAESRAEPPRLSAVLENRRWLRLLGAVIVPAALLSCLDNVAGFGVEATWPASGHSATALTWVVAGLMGMEALGAFLAERVRLPGRAGGLGLLGAAAIGVAVAAAFFPALAIPVAAVLSLLHGWAAPVEAARIQRLAADGQRATLASVASTVDMAANSAALPLGGVLLASLGASGTTGALGALALFVWLQARVTVRAIASGRRPRSWGTCPADRRRRSPSRGS